METKISVTQSIEMTMSALVMYWKRYFEQSGHGSFFAELRDKGIYFAILQ